MTADEVSRGGWPRTKEPRDEIEQAADEVADGQGGTFGGSEIEPHFTHIELDSRLRGDDSLGRNDGLG